MTTVTLSGTGTTANTGTLYTVLKELYDGQKPQELFEKEYPFLAMLDRKTDLGMRPYPLPFVASPAVGASPTFSEAQGNSAPGIPGEFMLTTSDIFGSAYIDVKTMQGAKNDRQGFIQAVQFATDTAIEGAVKTLALSLWRHSTGTKGTIQSIGSTGVFTLTNASDVVNFEIGEVLQASPDGVNARAAKGFVVAASVSAGTISVGATYGGAPASPNLWVVNDQLCVSGGVGLFQYGLLDWLTNAPGATPFMGIVRTNYMLERIAGTYYDGSKRLISEALSNWLTRISFVGGHPDYVYMNPLSYQGLINEMSQKAVVNFQEVKSGVLDFSCEAIVFRHVGGTIKIVADWTCPAATAFAIHSGHIKLYSIGDAPSVFDADGVPFLRVPTASQVELRLTCFAQIGVDAPVHFGCASLAY